VRLKVGERTPAARKVANKHKVASVNRENTKQASLNEFWVVDINNN
jgi:hypothetical protein